MSSQRLISAGMLALALAVGSPVAVLVAGQAKAPATPRYTPPRTPWGDPDIQGVYEHQTRVPLERPEQFAGKATLTNEELAKITIRTTGSQEFDPSNFNGGSGWNPLKFTDDNRTSLITDPPDGRIPLSEEGKRRYFAFEEHRRLNQEAMETWAEEAGYSRCISRAIPRLQQGYNGGEWIIQSPGQVTIVYEQFDTLIIPLDGRPTLDPKIRQWNGDSRGHWEGDTLVVEMTNFTDKQTGWPPFRDQAPWRKYAAGIPDQLDHTGIPRGNLKLTVRFTPVSPTRLEYSVTNEDPTWYTRPWTFMLPWTRSEGYIQYEYACSEGNLQMEDALRTRRYDEINGIRYEPPPEK